MPGGTVTSSGGALVIEDAAGSTVWFREKLTAHAEAKLKALESASVKKKKAKK
jgi:hypothetical protein